LKLLLFEFLFVPFRLSGRHFLCAVVAAWFCRLAAITLPTGQNGVTVQPYRQHRLGLIAMAFFKSDYFVDIQ